MARLEPTPKTIKKLFALSGNQCAFPGCSELLIDEHHNVVNICHIEAANPDGERYNPSQTDEERRSFDNLILFCANHHRVTNDVSNYTVETLKAMKRDHERQFRDKPYAPAESLIDAVLSKYSGQGIPPVINSGEGTQIVQVGLGVLLGFFPYIVS